MDCEAVAEDGEEDIEVGAVEAGTAVVGVGAADEPAWTVAGLFAAATVAVAGEVETGVEAAWLDVRAADLGTSVHRFPEMVVMELNDDIAECCDRQPSCQAQRAW